MVYGRRPKIRQPSQRKNWTQAFRMTDGTLVYYGQRGGMYYFLCCAGHGHGFAYLSDMIRAVNSHTHELGVYNGAS